MSSPDALTREAIAWRVLLDSGDVEEADRQRFQAWLGEHPGHQDAWKRVSDALAKTLSPLRHQADGHPAAARAWREVIERPPRRRFIRGALAFAGVGIGGGWLLSRVAPFDALGADFASGTGQRCRFTLDDGSVLQLNACSSVDRAADAGTRGLRLKRGEMLLSAQPGAKPFSVYSDALKVCNSGGRFMLRKEASRTLVVALEQPLTVEPGQGVTPFTLSPGDGAYVHEGSVTPYTGDATALAAWQHGRLEVDNQPLAQVIEALRAYRHGYIRLSPAAAQLPVLGVFPLDDTDRTLDLLAATLRIRVTRYGSLLVLIEPAQATA